MKHQKRHQRSYHHDTFLDGNDARLPQHKQQHTKNDDDADDDDDPTTPLRSNFNPRGRSTTKNSTNNGPDFARERSADPPPNFKRIQKRHYSYTKASKTTSNGTSNGGSGGGRGGGGGGGRIFGRGRGGHDEITKFAPSRHRGRQQGGSRGEGGRRRGGRRRDDEGRWWPTQTQKRQHQRQQQRRVRQHPLPGRANHLQMARHAARRIRHTSRLRGRRPERSGRIGAPRDTHRERSERRRRILDSSTGPSRPGNVRPDRNRSARDRHQSGGAGDPPIGSAAVPSRLFHRSDRSILRVGIDSGDAVHEVGEGAAVLLRGEGGDV
mmetsp:Transcript_33779/g.71017  ORF Transcript_33779/g.71017 Transcript_33779/m.71017 type:complete len:323 (-) Transcript_33779:484-1452(-)